MITVKDLGKTFKLDRQQRKEMPTGSRTVDAVSGITFTCKPGRVFTLVGPNGAGKTTTLRMVATLLKPTSGSITIAGINTALQPREVRRRIGFLTGSTRLYERMTPEEIVKYYADLYDMSTQLFTQRKDELFTLLGIHEFARRRIGKLSTGMRQKVSIARTMIHNPEIVVFDEPTTGLDIITSRHIIDLIRSCKESGKTVLFSTHIMGEVSLLSDDLAIIHNGKLCYNGAFEDFRRAMQTPSIEEEFIRLIGKAKS